VLQVITPATASKMTTLRVLHFHYFRCYNPVIPPGFCPHFYQIANQAGKVQALQNDAFYRNIFRESRNMACRAFQLI
jgi:hypothetical protein